MAIDEGRLKRLQDEGVVVGELSPAQQAVIDGLTPEEEEVIVAVRRRLEEADRVTGIEGPSEQASYPMVIHF
jgi:hypothetical protein